MLGWVRKEHYTAESEVEASVLQALPAWMLCLGLGGGKVWTRQKIQPVAKSLALIIFLPIFLTTQELP